DARGDGLHVDRRVATVRLQARPVVGRGRMAEGAAGGGESARARHAVPAIAAGPAASVAGRPPKHVGRALPALRSCISAPICLKKNVPTDAGTPSRSSRLTG